MTTHDTRPVASRRDPAATLMRHLELGWTLEEVSDRYGLPVEQLRGLLDTARPRHGASASVAPPARRRKSTAGRPPTLDDSPLRAGLSYRELDYWTRVGYLVAEDPAPGSGNRRRWAPGEVEVAARIKALVHAGVTLRKAADLARRPPGTYQLCDGVALVIREAR